MKKDGRGASYSWVAKIALCDGLEEGRFADVGETDLAKGRYVRISRHLRRVQGRMQPLGLGRRVSAHNATLQVVAGPAQRNLLLDNHLLGRHLS